MGAALALVLVVRRGRRRSPAAGPDASRPGGHRHQQQRAAPARHPARRPARPAAAAARWPRRRAARSPSRCTPPTAAGCRSPPRPGRSCSRACCRRAPSKSFTDKTRLRLVIGNAGGVPLVVNGTEIGAPGDRGQVARVHVRPRGPRRRLTRQFAGPPGRLGWRNAPHRPDGPACRAGHPRLRPQRGRLRGAGRPARRRRLAAGRRGRPTPTSSSSTPAGSSRRPSRTRSTRCWPPPTSRAAGAPRPSSRSAAWPSGTASSSPPACPRPTRCSASTTTPTSRPGSTTCSPATAHVPHAPRDRRTLLPLAPVDRPPPAAHRPRDPTCRPGWHLRPGRGRCGGGSATARSPRSSSPPAATGAAPSARSRPSAARSSPGRPHEVLAEADWLAGQGVRELVLVSENSTSYGKDLGDLRLLEKLLPAARRASTASCGCGSATCSRPRCAPAWSRRSPRTPGVAPYFDLSFQHASGPVLRRMRRFGDTERFLDLLGAVRAARTRGGRALQRHRRLPRRDRGRRRRARALPHRGPARRRSASSATPTRTAPRPPRFAGKVAEDVVARPGRAHHRAGRRAGRRSAPRSGSARPSRCSSRRSTPTAAPRRAGRRTRGPRSTARPRCRAARPASATWSSGRVVDTDGATWSPSRSGDRPGGRR